MLQSTACAHVVTRADALLIVSTAVSLVEAVLAVSSVLLMGSSSRISVVNSVVVAPVTFNVEAGWIAVEASLSESGIDIVESGATLSLAAGLIVALAAQQTDKIDGVPAQQPTPISHNVL